MHTENQLPRLPGSGLNCNETRCGGGGGGSSGGGFFTDNITTQQKLFCFVLLCFVGCGNNLPIGWNNPASSKIEKHSVDEKNMVEITITKPDSSPTQTEESLDPRRKPEGRKSLPTQKLIKRRQN